MHWYLAQVRESLCLLHRHASRSPSVSVPGNNQFASGLSVISVQGNPYKWNHLWCDLMHLVHLASCFKFPPSCSMYQHPSFLWLHVFVHGCSTFCQPFVCWWGLESAQLLAAMTSASWDSCIGFCASTCCLYFWIYIGVDFMVIYKCVLVWGEPPSFFSEKKSMNLKIFAILNSFQFMYMCVCGGLYVLSVRAEARKGKKRESYSPELELQVGAGDRVKFLCKSTKCLITEPSF